MADNYLRIYVHVLWKTWDKLPLLVPEVTATVYPILIGKAVTHGCKVLALGGVEDHVHMLLKFPATVALAEVVKEMKGASSRDVHKTFANRFFKWQGVYAALSVSPSLVPVVTHYIENQEDHHRRNYLDLELETLELPEEADL